MDDIEIVYEKSKGFYDSNCEEDGGKIIWSCKKRYEENKANLSEDEDAEVIYMTTVKKSKQRMTRKSKKETISIDDAWLLEDVDPIEADIPTHKYGKGAHIMNLMGWTGRALSKEGAILPLMPTLADSKKNKQGLGFEAPLRRNKKIYPVRRRTDIRKFSWVSGGTQNL